MTAMPLRGVFDLDLLEARPGIIVFRVSGKGARQAFRNEGGGHRWQRVPPSEKRGRVHTSTVTVAVLPEPAPNVVRLDDRDIEIETTRGQGPGGQHRQKNETCVSVRHKPTGLTARVDGRSMTANKEAALDLLRARIFAQQSQSQREGLNRRRGAQVGSGMRGDKRRTIRMQDGVVTDHLLGKRWRIADYLRGNWS